MVSGAATAAPHDNAADEDPVQPNWLWRAIRGLLRLTLPIFFRIKVSGAEKVPPRGAALLLINHQSFLDSMVVGTPLARPVSFLARDSLFRVPVLGWMLRNCYAMSVNREAASSSSLRLAADRLKRGFLVAIFPEGTRSQDGQIGPLKPGFIALIRRADAPVIPVGVAGTKDGLPRGAWFPRFTRCRVVFGDPIPREVLSKLVVKGNEEALLDEVHRRMVACQQEAEAWLRK